MPDPTLAPAARPAPASAPAAIPTPGPAVCFPVPLEVHLELTRPTTLAEALAEWRTLATQHLQELR